MDSKTQCIALSWQLSISPIPTSFSHQQIFGSLINILPRRHSNLPWIAKERNDVIGDLYGEYTSGISRCCSSQILSLGFRKVFVRVLSKLAKNIWGFIFDTYFSTLCAPPRKRKKEQSLPREILDTVRVKKCIHTARIRSEYLLIPAIRAPIDPLLMSAFWSEINNRMCPSQFILHK